MNKIYSRSYSDVDEKRIFGYFQTRMKETPDAHFHVCINFTFVFEVQDDTLIILAVQFVIF